MTSAGLFAAAKSVGGAPQPSMLDPAGPASHGIEIVWWILFGLALFVFVAVVALACIGVLRGRRTDAPPERADGLHSLARPFGASENNFIVIGGILVPLVILIVVGVVTVHATAAIWAVPKAPLRIDVDAADWFWIVHEPDSITTANEIPVPVGRPVEIELRSRDVIHSFWVPQLAAKVDVIPGQTNLIRFTADKTGIFRGQCAEFCGIQHAHMVFFVDVLSPSGYEQWLDRHRRTPPSPASATAVEGRDLFEQESCAGCHTIKGTSAQGTIGPNLTYLGSRRTLGAGTIDNTPQNLAAWIRNSQDFKPGNKMPPSELSPAQIDRIVAYLESQK